MLRVTPTPGFTVESNPFLLMEEILHLLRMWKTLSRMGGTTNLNWPSTVFWWMEPVLDLHDFQWSSSVSVGTTTHCSSRIQHTSDLHTDWLVIALKETSTVRIPIFSSLNLVFFQFKFHFGPFPIDFLDHSPKKTRFYHLNKTHLSFRSDQSRICFMAVAILVPPFNQRPIFFCGVRIGLTFHQEVAFWKGNPLIP